MITPAWTFALLAWMWSAAPAPLPAYPAPPQSGVTRLTTQPPSNELLPLPSALREPQYFCPRCQQARSGYETFLVSFDYQPAQQVRFCMRCLVDVLSQLVPPMVEAPQR